MKTILKKVFIRTWGEIIKFEDLSFKKPGNGISASKFKDIIEKIKTNQRKIKNPELQILSMINKKVVATIEARMGYKTPGKVLRIINGKPMLEYLIDSLKNKV